MNNEKSFGKKPKIVNVVASGSFSHELDIEKIYEEVEFVEASYEPETYPALLVKIIIDDNKRHVTLYRNGKYIIVGAKSEKEVIKIYNEIVRVLEQSNYL